MSDITDVPVRLPTITLEQAWKSICILQDIEPKNKDEEVALSFAVSSLQKVIKEYKSAELKREKNRAYYHMRMQDPEFVERKREKDRRYMRNHKEQILEKNRKYREKERAEAYAG